MTSKQQHSKALSSIQSTGGRTSAQPQASSPPSPIPLPGVLTEATKSEKRLFAAVIFRTPETLASKARNPKGLPEDLQRREKDLIKALPPRLLQSRSTSGRIANRWACKVHEPLNGDLLEALFYKIRYEAWGTHLNTLVPVKNRDAQELVANLRIISAYWIPPGDYEKLYMASPPRDDMYQDTDCDGCLLAAIAGDIVCLEAVRIAIYSRKHRGGRLVPWLDAWIRVHGKDALHRIRERSETVGRIVRNTKRASFTTLERQIKKDKRERDKSFLDELKYRERKLKSSDPFSPEARSYWEANKPKGPSVDSHAIPQEGEPNPINHVNASGPNPPEITKQVPLGRRAHSFYGEHFNPFDVYYNSDDDPLPDGESGYTSEYSTIDVAWHYREIERNGGWI
ncbi:unnamed protein product [Tuber melanosporum]|uniref:(Perigord truffle) hypothetical protein n=1 Tax=Tuber melanosporum (strain Mel28) TaxID=656061 RepID=D5GJG0_TUBMM|nr:uncharacterized protein GSTUM_00008984001 [Tuber melanosporum]CAZ84653.1 unnamed protein product [Tuber melanosporum]